MHMRSKSPISKYLILSIIILAVGVPAAYAITITLGGNPVEIFGVLDMKTNEIINVGTPTLSTDAATKGYVDSNNFQFINTVERTGSFVPVISPGEATSSVSCNANEVATGGGWVEGVALGDPVIFDNHATFTGLVPTGWTVLWGTFTGDESLAATVICATLQNTSPFP